MSLVLAKTRVIEFFKAVAILHQVMNTVHRLRNYQPIGSTHPCAWLIVFNQDELIHLTADVEKSLQHGFLSGDWSEVPVTLERWHTLSRLKNSLEKSLKPDD